MRSVRLRWLSVPALLLAATAVLVPNAAQADQPTQGAVPSTVTLITGDQVRTATNRLVSGAPAGAYVGANGDRYLVPEAAIGHLNTPLDQSLFDVTALASQPNPAPLRLSFANGVTPSAPPGITLTSTSGATATGYESSAPAFAAALHHGALAPGLTTIALANRPATVSPHYVLHTVQFTATTIPGTNSIVGGCYVMGLDPNSQPEDVPFANGVERLELPAGHYVAVTVFLQLDSNNRPTGERYVTSAFTVPDTTGTTTNVSFDESTASHQVIVGDTPKPATQQDLVLGFGGQRADGSSAGSSEWPAFNPTDPVYVNALPALSTGKLRFVVTWGGTSPTASDPYNYSVAFASPNGIPATETYPVLPSQLVTAHVKVYSTAGTASDTVGVSAYDPAVADQMGGGSSQVTAPGTLTEYLGTADGSRWAQNLDSPGISVFGQPAPYPPGRDYTVDLNHGPLNPAFGTFFGAQPTCIACATGAGEMLYFPGIGGDTLDQYAQLGQPPATIGLTMYENGTQVFSATGTKAWDGIVNTVPTTTAATFRSVYDLDATGSPGLAGTATSHTDLTFHYNPKATPQNTLPAEVYGCLETATSPCQVLPVLTTAYQLDTDLTGVSNAPIQTLHLQVSHLSYDGQGSHSPITSVTVKVSFDSGKTWQPSVVSGHNGDYTALWPNVANTHPMLQVTATDAAGGSISQTFTNAYTVAATLAH